MSHNTIFCKWKFLTIMFWLIVVLISCEKRAEQIPPHLIPYSSLESDNFSENILLKKELVQDHILESSIHLENIYGSTSPPAPIDFINMGAKGSLVYLHDVQKLYHFDNDITVEIVAESGNGPDSIQSGIKMINTSKKPLLLQRNRISEIVHDNQCKLSVLEGIDEFYNYVNHFSDSVYVTSGYNRNGDPPVYLKDQNWQTIKSIGEGFVHSDPEITAYFNFGSIVLNDTDKHILHTYSAFPTLAIIDPISDEIWPFTIRDFYPNKLTDRDKTGELVDYRVKHSNIFSLKSLPGGYYWIGVIHSKEEEAHPYNAFDRWFYFDYYLLNREAGFEYAGSSTSVVVPDRNQVLIMKNFELFLFDADIFSLIDELIDIKFEPPF